MIYVKNIRLINNLPERFSVAENIDFYINTATRSFSLLQKGHNRIAVRAEDILKIKIQNKKRLKPHSTGLQLSLFENRPLFTDLKPVKIIEFDFQLHITYTFKKQKNNLIIDFHEYPFLVFTSLTSIAKPYGTPFYWSGNPVLLSQCLN